MSDYISDETVTTDEMSDYGKLNATRRELVATRDLTNDEGLYNRCNILIGNIDLLKKDSTDKALLKQFAKNMRDLERYRTGGL